MSSTRWLIAGLSAVAAITLLCALASAPTDSWGRITTLKAMPVNLALKSMGIKSQQLAEAKKDDAKQGGDGGDGSIEWTYGIDAEKGPLNWPKLYNSTLKTGFCDLPDQSPIDVETKEAKQGFSDMLHPNWANHTNFTVVNNGRFFEIYGDAVTNDYTVFRGDDIWNLTRIVMHSPSEHRIDNMQFPLELQFMHSRPTQKKDPQGIWKDTTEYMAISVLYAMGADDRVPTYGTEAYTLEDATTPNPTLLHELLWDTVKSLGPGESKAILESQGPDGFLNAQDLVPKNLDYFQYTGSLTYPPCTPDFTWLVVKAHRFVTYEQMQNFPTGSYRPPQLLNGRSVAYLSGTPPPPAPTGKLHGFVLDCGLYGDNCGGKEYYVGHVEKR